MGFNIMESLKENRLKAAADKTTVADERIKTEYINIDDIKPYPRQNEVYGSEDDELSLQKLDELKASIKAVGVMQNIVVKENPAGGYTMLSGHRRWLACKSLVGEGYTDKQFIPATVLRNSKDIEDRFKFLTMNSTIRNKNNYQVMQEMLELLSQSAERVPLSIVFSSSSTTCRRSFLPSRMCFCAYRIQYPSAVTCSLSVICSTYLKSMVSLLIITPSLERVFILMRSFPLNAGLGFGQRLKSGRTAASSGPVITG